jgi:hypothetical protein
MSLLILGLILIFIFPRASSGKELPKVAVWDLVPRDTKGTYAQELTSILVSEISKLQKYEVYSQENVRTLAGWTAERMTLGCTDTKCLTALGQMDIVKLVSGSVGKIGNRYSVSLNLFDTQNARAEKAISEFCGSEDELIELVQVAARKIMGVEVLSSPVQVQRLEVKPSKNEGVSSIFPSTEGPLNTLLAVIATNNYDTLLANAAPTLKTRITRETFTQVSNQLSPRLKKGYQAQYFGSIKQQSVEVFVWKITYQDGGDDMLARLVLQGNKVAGFWFQ